MTTQPASEWYVHVHSPEFGFILTEEYETLKQACARRLWLEDFLERNNNYVVICLDHAALRAAKRNEPEPFFYTPPENNYAERATIRRMLL